MLSTTKHVYEFLCCLVSSIPICLCGLEIYLQHRRSIYLIFIVYTFCTLAKTPLLPVILLETLLQLSLHFSSLPLHNTSVTSNSITTILTVRIPLVSHQSETGIPHYVWNLLPLLQLLHLQRCKMSFPSFVAMERHVKDWSHMGIQQRDSCATS